MLNDLPLMGFITKKMQWHQNRQSVLASNVANADTPNYQPHDLKALEFDQHLSSAQTSFTLRRTHDLHFHGDGPDSGGFEANSGQDFEVTPSGNAVVLEDQMMKVAENQFDYQTASTVYQKSLGLLKIAIAR